MLQYIVRRLLVNIPIYLGILLVVMVALRVNDPAAAYVGKNTSEEELNRFRELAGLNDPLHEQYWSYLKGLDLDKDSWKNPGLPVRDMLADAVGPTVAITLPALLLTSVLSIVIGLVAAFNRGKGLDRTLVVFAVVGMSVSFLVYIVLGQYFGAFRLNESLGSTFFAVQGYDTTQPGWWFKFCLLPVLISTIVSMGYDTRFYRSVMVEETTKDYIRTARAKGLTENTVMFKHMLKNAMVSIVTRVMITLPFLVTGSILLEMYFNIPGMGKVLITAINAKDFPVIQGFTAVFAVIFIISNILTDVLYSVVDPRVRLS
ncbi:MAG: ABC transporter permease [Planctomycetota bacterium]|jgi:peptide/nickel transport system permease protein